MTGFPIERRQWVCSDGRVFYDEKEATAHEKELESKKKVHYTETWWF